MNIPSPQTNKDKSGNDDESEDEKEQRTSASSSSSSKVKQTYPITKTSKFRGVSYLKERGIWRARIEYKGKREHLGYFDSEIEAAHVYDERVLHVFGKYSKFNFPDRVKQNHPEIFFASETISHSPSLVGSSTADTSQEGAQQDDASSESPRQQESYQGISDDNNKNHETNIRNLKTERSGEMVYNVEKEKRRRSKTRGVRDRDNNDTHSSKGSSISDDVDSFNMISSSPQQKITPHATDTVTTHTQRIIDKEKAAENIITLPVSRITAPLFLQPNSLQIPFQRNSLFHQYQQQSIHLAKPIMFDPNNLHQSGFSTSPSIIQLQQQQQHQYQQQYPGIGFLGSHLHNQQTVSRLSEHRKSFPETVDKGRVIYQDRVQDVMQRFSVATPPLPLHQQSLVLPKPYVNQLGKSESDQGKEEVNKEHSSSSSGNNDNEDNDFNIEGVSKKARVRNKNKINKA